MTFLIEKADRVTHALKPLSEQVALAPMQPHLSSLSLKILFTGHLE